VTSRTYVTEYEGSREPPELQVMHKHAMTEPDMKAEAAQLGGGGPRPDQTQKGLTMSTPTTDRPRQERAEGPRLPTRAELYRATEATRATMKDPAADLHTRYQAAEKEAATAWAYEQRHGSQPKVDLERWSREEEKEAG
jgi:hypothetical protein